MIRNIPKNNNLEAFLEVVQTTQMDHPLKIIHHKITVFEKLQYVINENRVNWRHRFENIFNKISLLSNWLCAETIATNR